MSCRVLIVDDSPILRRAMRKAVVQAGIADADVREAGNGREALTSLDAATADVVLLDVNMPIMDGVAFARSLHESGRIAKLRVLVVTTESNDKRLAELRTLGVHGFLRKPFEPEDLRRAVADLSGVRA